MEHWKQSLEKANHATRCGAKTRCRTLCQSPAMKNGRCRMHGGKSPGAPLGTDHGRYKQGLYTQAAQQERLRLRSVLKSALDVLQQLS